MASSHILQIFLWITIQDQIRIAQWVSSSTQPVSMLNLQILSLYFMCDFRDTSFLIRFWTHSRRGRAGACRGKAPPSCLRKTALPLKSPTGAFIAAQPRHSHFRRKRKIRTLLLSRKGSDFHCLVRVVIQHFLKTIVVQFVFEVVG